MIYYRFAFQDRQTAKWRWKTTPLTSLQAVFQLLRAFSALPQDSIRVFAASSTGGLNEMLDSENNGHTSGSITASQFLQERNPAVREPAQGASGRRASRPGGQAGADIETWAKDLWERHTAMGSTQAVQPGASVATSTLLRGSININGASPSPGMSLLQQKRLEIERGAGGDHDTPYLFTLPTSLKERLAWVYLQARVQAGELLS